MERTASILPIQTITADHVSELVTLQDELSSIKYYKERHNAFRRLVPELSDRANWLITFAVWFCEHNSRFNKMDVSRYYSLQPTDIQQVTFYDFIKLIQKYNRKRVDHKNEIYIVKFLQGCDPVHFNFYLSLFSKTFIKSLPITEVYDVLDMGKIDLQDIYGAIEMLQTSFSELSYPVAITMLPDPDYKLVVQSREPRKTYSYYQHGSKLKVTKDLISLDAKMINTPRYTVIGYSDVKLLTNRKKMEQRTIIYPLDYFGTFKEYRGYVKTKTDRYQYTPFKERIENLKGFLHDNYLRQFVKTPIGFAETSSELIQELHRLYPRDGSTFVIVTDNNTARTGKAVAIPVTSTAGMIHSIWISEGIPKGFRVWFNGELHDVLFDFSGANGAILNDPAIVLNKMLEFVYIRIGTDEVFLSKHINWEQLQWKNSRIKSGAYIEKCALCGGTDQPHKLQGLCKVCEINIRKYFTNYGPGVWIPPSRRMSLKRGLSGWAPKILLACKPSFKGHYIEARDDGYWTFRFDEERVERYVAYLKKKRRINDC